MLNMGSAVSLVCTHELLRVVANKCTLLPWKKKKVSGSFFNVAPSTGKKKNCLASVVLKKNKDKVNEKYSPVEDAPWMDSSGNETENTALV